MSEGDPDLTRALLEGQLSAQRFEAVFRSAPVGTSIVRLEDLTVVDVNPAWLAMNGFSREEVLGRSIADHGVWQDTAQLASLLERLRAEKSVVNVDIRQRRKDGVLRDRLVSGEVFDLAGEPHAVIITIDVSDRKWSERALRDSDKLEAMVEARTAELEGAVSRLRLLIESSADGIYGMDAAGKITFVNGAAARILGYSPQWLLGRNAHETFHYKHEDGSPYPQTECSIESALHVAGSVRADDEVFWHKDGHAVPVSYAAHAIVEGGQIRGVVCSFSDASARRAAEVARDRALAEAQRLARVRSEFLANMSHEIRTPLNAVLGFAQIGSLDNEDPAVRKVFARIVDSGQLLLGVINDILDFTRIESGKLTIERRKVNLARLVENAAAVTRDSAHSKGIDFRIERHPGAPETFGGDELRIGQVLVNLLSNAVKFTESGWVSLDVERRDDQLVFTVRDSGIGMSATQIERAFEPFEQADSSMTRRYGGTGLGLAISKRLVGLMGGQIHATSEPGRGSSFEVSLPLSDAAAATGRFHTLSATDAIDRAPRLRGLSILAAEDNENNQLVLEFMLKTEGAAPTFAYNGAELLEILQVRGAEAFDIVLMDVQMPVMDGYEAAQKVRSLAPGLPIVGLTAHAMSEARDKCLAVGMVEHVAKPIDLDQLVRVILKYVGVASPRGFEPRSQP